MFMISEGLHMPKNPTMSRRSGSHRLFMTQMAMAVRMIIHGMGTWAQLGPNAFHNVTVSQAADKRRRQCRRWSVTAEVAMVREEMRHLLRLEGQCDRKRNGNGVA